MSSCFRPEPRLLTTAVVEHEEEPLFTAAQRNELHVLRQLEERELEAPAERAKERVEHGVVADASHVDGRSESGAPIRDRHPAGEVPVHVFRERRRIERPELLEPTGECPADETLELGGFLSARDVGDLDPEDTVEQRRQAPGRHGAARIAYRRARADDERPSGLDVRLQLGCNDVVDHRHARHDDEAVMREAAAGRDDVDAESEPAEHCIPAMHGRFMPKCGVRRLDLEREARVVVVEDRNVRVGLRILEDVEALKLPDSRPSS